MKYIDIKVKTAFIVHGFDETNQEIIENINDDKYMRKLISIDRIQSISEDYILVTSSHQRVMYWEYDDTLENLKQKLDSAGLILN
ncbi:MAG: hypothetical protein H6613_10155 [Ignavibacteriales bacterium]|nr:hypothetical protein [Ignavibacteriota bacterium]MCB0746935.1 hypothetical protein [Ignavibacteriota bacterium]MCB9248866.1 hypothetical protein [Ignavibacteriales bacterium]